MSSSSAPARPHFETRLSSTEPSLTRPPFTYFLYSSSFIFKQKVSRTFLSSQGWIRPVLLTSMSLKALITVLTFLKICVEKVILEKSKDPVLKTKMVIKKM